MPAGWGAGACGVTAMALSRSVARKTAARTAKAPPGREGVTLPLFVWEGTDKRGKKMKGEQQSRNANLLRAELRRQGINPTLVKAKPKPLFGGGGSRIKPRDIAIFSRQLATMMKSGVPLITALEIIGNGQKNIRMKKLVDAQIHVMSNSRISWACCSAPPGPHGMIVAPVDAIPWSSKRPAGTRW